MVPETPKKVLPLISINKYICSQFSVWWLRCTKVFAYSRWAVNFFIDLEGAGLADAGEGKSSTSRHQQSKTHLRRLRSPTQTLIHTQTHDVWRYQGPEWPRLSFSSDGIYRLSAGGSVPGEGISGTSELQCSLQIAMGRVRRGQQSYPPM
jgi:hypothetical protein